MRRPSNRNEVRYTVQELLDGVQDLFYVLDDDGDLVRWNDRLPAVTGHADEEIAEMSPLDFFSEGHTAEIEAAIEAGRRSVPDRPLPLEGVLSTGNTATAVRVSRWSRGRTPR